LGKYDSVLINNNCKAIVKAVGGWVQGIALVGGLGGKAPKILTFWSSGRRQKVLKRL